MDRINKNNYEAYFLDYHEGRLNSVEKQAVMAFLQENPECFDAFQDFESVTLPVPEIRYPDKSELYKTDVSMPEADEWEYLCIAYMEGDLSGDELEDFENQRRSDPEKDKVLNTFLLTRSLPDESIHFENKGSLKKKVVLIPRWIYGAVSAAAILILGWIFINPIGDRAGKPSVAENDKRETIYIDKLAHPRQYEKIAFSDPVKSLASPGQMLEKAASASEIIDSDINIDDRENFAMASIASIRPSSLESGELEIPSPESVFAFRSIPGAQDDEYQTLLAFSGDFIRKQLLNQDPELVEKSKFSIWELADAGLEKISSIFGTNADIEREYSESGELLAVSFESQLFGFNTPIKRRSSVKTD